MKKFLVLFLLAVFIFAGCDEDSKIIELDQGVGPFVIATLPANHSLNVMPDNKIMLYFNEKVITDTVEENLTLWQNGRIVEGLVFFWKDSQIVSIALANGNPFEESTLYNLRLAKGFQDLDEIHAKKSFFLEFTTGAAGTPPTFDVTGVSPEDGSTLVQFTGNTFTIFFSDYVCPETITDASVYLSSGAANVPAEMTISTDLRSVTFKVTASLVAATTYTLTVTTAVTNNRVPEMALAADFTATYTTGDFTNNASSTVLKFTHGKTANSGGTVNAEGSSDYPITDASESDNYSN